MTTEGSIDEDEWHAPPSSSSSASWEIDSAYEFDANQFFDFSRPESSSDAERAERWFQVAGYYPPSHFYFKAKVKTTANDESPLVVKDDDDFTPSHHHHHLSSSSNHEKTTKGGRRRWNNSGHQERIEEDSPSKELKPKEKSKIKWGGDDNNRNYKERSSGGSTLMKQTASQLAKLNHVKQQRRNHEAIKRLKLDYGYCVTKKSKVSDEKKLLQHPPIELFSKLTLNSDMENRAASHPKPHPFGNVNLNKFSPKR
ncbi:unnamed protein product [Cuscuta campestris]|uniref:TPX2 central domain-containing protein n=1 Tax=Cuscuta campestris TaxID=132261 RepID=A0A484LVL2_9ASTE|nr:unnamed protein product [Cuscuta campestris]